MKFTFTSVGACYEHSRIISLPLRPDRSAAAGHLQARLCERWSEMIPNAATQKKWPAVCFGFSLSSPSNAWWQTMAGWQALSRPSAAGGGAVGPPLQGLPPSPDSATEVDGWLLLIRLVAMFCMETHRR